MVSSMRPGRPDPSTVNNCFPAFPKAPWGSQGGCYCTHFTDEKMEAKGFEKWQSQEESPRPWTAGHSISLCPA